jgi:hypothetical protein
MKTGVGLALICVGAIFAFAVTANTSYFNLNTAGWVLMVIGVIGLLLPNRTYGWLGQRLLVRRSYPNGRVEQVPVAPYAAQNPGSTPVRLGLPARPILLDQDQDLIEETQVPPAGGGSRGRPAAGTTEVVEDIYEQP